MKINLLLNKKLYLFLALLLPLGLAAQTYNMCSSTAPTINSPLTGSFYDSGGPTGAYLNAENCTVLFQAPPEELLP